MSFLHDAIMESNALEDRVIHEQKIFNKKMKTKLSEQAQVEPQKEPLEECGDIPVVVEESCQEEKDLNEEKLTEETYVDIEEYLPETAYIEESVKPQINENVTELHDRYAKGRPGSPEYDANDRRRAREAEYRKLINVDSDFEITEDNIKDWALNRVCSDFRCDPTKVRAELLKQPYTGLEKYSED